MNDLPLWFRVLHHFDTKGCFNNGISIPFLLGASSIIDPSENILSVADFFDQAIDETLPRKISLQKCGLIGEYVFGIVDYETIKYPYGKPVSRQFGNICITDNSFLNVTDFHKVQQTLVEESQDLLNSGLYSINKGKWGNYSEEEKSRLEELK